MSFVAMLNGAGERKAASVLLLLVLTIAWAVPLLGPALSPPKASPVGQRGHAGDFIAYYAAARLSALGSREVPYAAKDFVEYSRSLGARTDRDFAWAYPPFTLIWLAPLGTLPLSVALWTWIFAIAAAAALTARLILGNWRCWWVGVLFPGTALSIVCGQNGTFSGLLLAAGLVGMRSRPGLAGCAWGLLTFKPQFAAVPATFVASQKVWRTLGVMIATALSLVAGSLAIDGTDVWFAFFEALRQQAEYARASLLPVRRMVTPLAAVATHTGHMGTAGAVQACVTLAVLVHVVRGGISHVPLHSALTLTMCMFLASPYAYDYDLAMLGVPCLMLIKEWRSSGRLPGRNLAWLWFLAAAPPCALFSGVLLDRSVVSPILIGSLCLAHFFPPVVDGPKGTDMEAS